VALTNKQQVFVNQYLTCWNASEAARIAEYAHPGSQGHRLLNNVEIAEEIKRRVDEMAMSADEVLIRLSEHARASIADFVEFKPGINEPYLNMKQAAEQGKLGAVKKFKYDSNGHPEIELHDAQAALVQLGRVHGLFTDKQEVTGPDGGPVQIRTMTAVVPDAE